MKRAIMIVRSLYVEGSHLHSCFAATDKRIEGWRKMQQAKRIATRLGYKLSALVPLLVLFACLNCSAAMPKGFDAKMADAIWKAEGGHKTKWPYGVKSVKVSSVAEARRVTLVSVRNNWNRWERAGKPEPFVRFMARRWCPESADPVGHVNWIKNVGRSMK